MSSYPNRKRCIGMDNHDLFSSVAFQVMSGWALNKSSNSPVRYGLGSRSKSLIRSLLPVSTACLFTLTTKPGIEDKSFPYSFSSCEKHKLTFHLDCCIHPGIFYKQVGICNGNLGTAGYDQTPGVEFF